MFSKQKTTVLGEQFQRIFTLPLTRSTFRELQNAILIAAEGDQEKANIFLAALLEKKDPDTRVMDMRLHELIQQFSVPARVAKEVHERGEAMSMMTSDMSVQGENVIFSTRIRRIDGSDFHFVADAAGFLQVLHHYVSRFVDATRTEVGQKIVSSQKGTLIAIRDLLDKLINS